MSFPVEAAVERAGFDASRPKLMDWLERIHARPAYQRAVKRGIEVESSELNRLSTSRQPKLASSK